jgi:hypothetical protein
MSKKNDRGMANDIMDAVLAGTKKWARTRKQEERSPASRSYRYARMTHERGVQFKEAAAEIMPEAYAKVSGNGEYPANARQLMYAARPHIQKQTGKPLGDQYFTQTLLPDYLNETGVDWDVVYDSRGHFSEPHGGRVIGLGTIEVRDYLAELHNPRILGADFSQAKVETLGPSGSFGGIALIEKEGFDSMLDKAKIAERFDVGMMSTKGMSVTAARALADEMCAAHDIPLMILRDFDKSGFSIAGTLERDTRRYEFKNTFTRIHLGLSLADVTAMGLEFEHQQPPEGQKGHDDRQPSRERRDRGGDRLPVRGLRPTAFHAPRRAQCDDVTAIHRLRRAQAAGARRREDCPGSGVAGQGVRRDRARQASRGRGQRDYREPRQGGPHGTE